MTFVPQTPLPIRVRHRLRPNDRVPWGAYTDLSDLIAPGYDTKEKDRRIRILSSAHTSTSSLLLSQDTYIDPMQLLDLSDEVLLLITQQLDRHDDLLQARLACRKLRDLSDNYMYRNVMLTLDEEITNRWEMPLQCMPDGITKTKHLTILNRAIIPGGHFFRNAVPQPHSYRILRWNLLEEMADASEMEFGQSAFFKGVKFRWNTRLGKNQLTSFRWRHATTLSLPLFVDHILTRHANSLQDVEIAMITPPTSDSADEFGLAVTSRAFPKLRSLTYNGLSHTEPIAINQPAAGGRFRMLRPLFRKTHATLEELVLSQDHCISQVGKTPWNLNGRVFDDLLCDLDEIYAYPAHIVDAAKPYVELKLSKLELGGFKVGSLFESPTPVAPPRVRISLPTLRRLVLNDCHQSATLLRELTIRHKEVCLTEFGFRYQEQEGDPGMPMMSKDRYFEETSNALGAFLVTFKGLQTLSLLWHGPHAPHEIKISEALSHHSQTLSAYSYAIRENEDNQTINDTLRFVAKPTNHSPWTKVFSKDGPKLKEFGLSLPGLLDNKGYPCLRLLSQFENLRTVQIRNFPRIQHLIPGKHESFWRDREGVTNEGKEMAAKFAEMIALPFYGLPFIYEEDPEVADLVSNWDLQKLADQHATDRDQKLLGGIKLKSIFHTSVPNRDITLRILKQRADVDFHFANILQKVEDECATLEETAYYQSYADLVRSTLGYTRPLEDGKPKLRLLVVGDWRYRDQMNLTGPRTYDPDAWCTSRSVPDDPTNDESQDVDDDDDSEAEVREREYGSEVSGGVHYRLRNGFKQEYDVSLLPIFFKIDWEPVRDRKGDRKWRWTAIVSVLDQTTLEGYAALSDVKTLDFAWQN